MPKPPLEGLEYYEVVADCTPPVADDMVMFNRAHHVALFLEAVYTLSLSGGMVDEDGAVQIVLRSVTLSMTGTPTFA